MKCKHSFIGIYKSHGSSAGNLIWISLREAQHLVFCLAETLHCINKTILENDLESWKSLNRNISANLDSNSPAQEVEFFPFPFHTYNIPLDKSYDQSVEPEVDIETLNQNKPRRHDIHENTCPRWVINSIAVHVYSPKIDGPYFIQLYKSFGENPFNYLYVSVHEAQHLVLMLGQLITKGVQSFSAKSYSQ